MTQPVRTFEDRHWRVVARTHVGLVRERQEDAWTVLLDQPFLDRRVTAFAVFDGLGGEPHGKEAAEAAAAGLPDVLGAAKDFDEVLPRLNARVRATGGAATAVIAVLEADAPEEGWLLTVGDSAAYGLLDGRVALLAPKDSRGSNVVSDYLGNPALSGHRLPVTVASHESLVLCTDGVDGVVGTAPLKRLLAASRDRLEEETEALIQWILARGAPDNATVVVARRRG